MLHAETPVAGLPVFSPACELPLDVEETRRALASRTIRRVHSHVLGPPGTNIMQAAERWHENMRITEKAELVICDTPEQAVSQARATTEGDVLAIYWTCAVFVRENRVFFDNPDTLPFTFQQAMPLDEMQLATRPELAERFTESVAGWRILSHPSPAPLVAKLRCQVVEADSNAAAAGRCAAGEAEACVTTETARRLYGLVKLHSFGSPTMIFFGGVCQRGATLLRRALADSTPAMRRASLRVAG
jgi:hypothetical protein